VNYRRDIEIARPVFELQVLAAGFGIKHKEMAGDVAAGTEKEHFTRRYGRPGLAEAFEDLAPFQFPGRRIVGGEVPLRSASCVEWLIDGVDVKETRPRAVGQWAVVGAAAGAGSTDLVRPPWTEYGYGLALGELLRGDLERLDGTDRLHGLAAGRERNRL